MSNAARPRPPSDSRLPSARCLGFLLHRGPAAPTLARHTPRAPPHEYRWETTDCSRLFFYKRKHTTYSLQVGSSAWRSSYLTSVRNDRHTYKRVCVYVQQLYARCFIGSLCMGPFSGHQKSRGRTFSGNQTSSYVTGRRDVTRLVWPSYQDVEEHNVLAHCSTGTVIFGHYMATFTHACSFLLLLGK